MDLQKRIDSIKDRIRIASDRVGRKPEDIKLLAVTKTRTIQEIDDSLNFGIEYIGENKVQESEKKIPILQNKIKEFHFIGHLQSNKIKKLMPLRPALIHSIDKLSTARKLNNYLENNSDTQNILIEVNTSGEESKFGVRPDEAINFVNQVSKLKNLKIKGLMTIGLFTSETDKIRACFISLKDLFNQIKSLQISNVEMKYLSMGMTNDFEIAIEEGANIVRIGTAIYGPRNY